MASEYLKWKYRNVKPEEPAPMTAAQRRKNWWYYHKWHVLIAAVVLLAAADWVWNAPSQVHPDYQAAYVGSAPLAEEAQARWEARLAALGTDCNGDGKVVVRLNQYLTMQNGSDGELAMYNYAANVKLLADLDARESYIFLLEDPERFQADYEVLKEGWFPVENGLYLARREFWEDRTAEHMEACDALWERLAEEMS